MAQCSGRACHCPALGDRKGRPYIYILSCMPSPPFTRAPCIHARLRRLAMNRHEISGLKHYFTHPVDLARNGVIYAGIRTGRSARRAAGYEIPRPAIPTRLLDILSYKVVRPERNIHDAVIDSAHKGYFLPVLTYQFRYVVRIHASLEDVYAHVYHVRHKRRRVRVAVVNHKFHAVRFTVTVYFFVRREDELVEHFRGEERRAVAAQSSW